LPALQRGDWPCNCPRKAERRKKPSRANAFLALWGRLKQHPLARLGPGLITGVADDDPSGIATYSQAGAQFGLNGVVAVPLMVVIILLASRKSVMGAFTSSRHIVVLAWIGTAIMGLAAALMLVPGQ
jgi:Mn2+/Fe2+ NRAMP family transporter